MDWQTLAWIGGAVVAAITVYNFIVAAGRRLGATDAQVKQYTEGEKAWTVRYDALHNLVTMHHQQTNDRFAAIQLETSARFEKVMDRLNEALLTMAREHPTKADLLRMKEEILTRIDTAEYAPPNGRRKVLPK